MKDFLDKLGHAAQNTIIKGYYNLSRDQHLRRLPCISLQQCIRQEVHIPIIAEVKLASPSLGQIRKKDSIQQLATSLERGGAVALSILTEPKYFSGSIARFSRIRETVNLPLLMKDIIISPRQIDAAATIGADAILLIHTLFQRGYGELDLSQMIDYAHALDLEVLLETHTLEEFSSALDTSADLVGINNRDLSSLQVNIHTTIKILQCIQPLGRLETKVIVSESGITGPQDIQELHRQGAHAFLVGSTIMKAPNPEETLRKLVMAI
jgi:indole-3-glycerol phosphate synthase